MSVPTTVGDTVQSYPTWMLDRIDQHYLPLDNQYQYSLSGSGVHVWIVDGGVDLNASQLTGRIDTNTYVTHDGLDPFSPCYGHGTLMAVAAAGTNDGIAKNATINVARVDSDCSGDLSTGAASFAFEFIGDYSPRPAVANYSARGTCGWLGCGQTVDDAAKYARSKGVTVVVSAGNDSANACDYWPAHVSELITVGAVDQSDQRWSYSNYGSCVDLFAPATSAGGTSTATAMVTGVAAVQLQGNPTGSPDWLTWKITSTATPNILGNRGSGSPNLLLYSDPPLLEATISGPGAVTTAGNQTWTASAINGGGPYSYQWYMRTNYWWPRGGATCHYETDWVAVGTGTNYSRYVSLSTLDFDLRVDVVSGSEQTSATKTVVVGDGSQVCPS